jgi:hypothetical protein
MAQPDCPSSSQEARNRARLDNSCHGALTTVLVGVFVLKAASECSGLCFGFETKTKLTLSPLLSAERSSRLRVAFCNETLGSWSRSRCNANESTVVASSGASARRSASPSMALGRLALTTRRHVSHHYQFIGRTCSGQSIFHSDVLHRLGYASSIDPTARLPTGSNLKCCVVDVLGLEPEVPTERV